MDFNSWLLFASLSALASMTPGPSVVATVIHTLESGVRGTISSLTGHLIAVLAMATVAALATTAMLHTAPEIFKVMKIAGGAYLAWMGIKMIRGSFSPTNNSDVSNTAVAKVTSLDYVVRSLLVSISNPKAVLFLSAVFPAFIDRTASVPFQFFILFMTIIFVVTTVHGVYAYMALRAKGARVGTPARKVISRISGFSFLGFGVSFIYDAQK